MSGFSKVKMSAFRICTFAIIEVDCLICWCLCRIKNLNDCRSCKKFVINALASLKLLSYFIFQSVKSDAYCKNTKLKVQLR